MAASVDIGRAPVVAVVTIVMTTRVVHMQIIC